MLRLVQHKPLKLFTIRLLIRHLITKRSTKRFINRSFFNDLKRFKTIRY